jgi:hypothetical protein
MTSFQPTAQANTLQASGGRTFQALDTNNNLVKSPTITYNAAARGWMAGSTPIRIQSLSLK